MSTIREALEAAASMLSAVAGDIEDGLSPGDLRGKYVTALINARDNARAALSTGPDGWRTMESAPKDGTRILFGGRFKPFDIHAGGEWTECITSWSTLKADSSDKSAYRWYGADFGDVMRHNVNWTHWQPLPAPPANQEGGKR